MHKLDNRARVETNGLYPSREDEGFPKKEGEVTAKRGGGHFKVKGGMKKRNFLLGDE